MNARSLGDVRRTTRVFEYDRETGNVSEACRYFGITRKAHYKWQLGYRAKGEAGPVNSERCPQNLKLRIKPEIEEKILNLLRNYQFSQARIASYLARFHKIKISPGGVREVLVRNGINRLPRNTRTSSPGPSYKLYQ
ncbi:hypothetical protein E3A20_21500 [Planctomyces bekefii]|uniref:Transposase n=1 Tax=Planctomyces bekefii TaxID=1653850 RepID=A0A5C6M1U7_9PLAN|nr:hypothetical protein E3A20_21500 [Planctomyces bekefii]